MLDKIWVPDRKILSAKSTRVLERLLTDLFSQYIRRKEAHPITGATACFTCGRVGHWKNMHCGHFVGRANMCTKFDERNNQVQCLFCNNVKRGNLEEYAKRLDLKYGIGTAEDLKRKGRQTCKFMRSDIIDIIQDTKENLDKLDRL